MPQDNADVAAARLSEQAFKIAGLIILSIRFVQGWIFWGGGSRRFIYAPQKLDPEASQWMANKLQSAMPGALLGMSDLISFLLHHFYLLYAAIIIFSLAELVSGAALMLGCFTRVSGFITALISITLMLIFGWQGSTCMDEWTMAVANLAIGLTLALSGSPIYSVDHWLLRRYPRLNKQWWFLSLASGPWSFTTLRRVSLFYCAFTILFTLSTYNYYRGAIFSSYHPGPVSASQYHMTLSQGVVERNGMVRFNLYVDAGTAAAPSHIIRVELRDADGTLAETWEAKHLSLLPDKNIQNEYAYNRIATGGYGLIAPVSAKAFITLPPVKAGLNLSSENYQLYVYTVSGRRYELELK
ncbi:TQO small subunit DoxD [Aquicella lusitana]|uniref:Thiosulfate dehydrogenase [quinone] large subunit n=2 Tax=Aquicella lusitana TaxID=254246 RepID=A0A370GL97_9COXI|nr:TQO small subunit DoxD [Aquicella lusitana]RDI44548.1 thiosulfate dehydrogenase [quinone] large subunit [Aquicella lusitana]VVC72510.1 hypothetical protein AQULUS_02220 [Aquicella lusitana]